MMGLFEHWPYVNFHDLNLDWIIKEIPKVFKSRDEAQASAEASAESAAASQLSADAALASQEAARQSELNAAQSEENASESEANAKNYSDHIADPVSGIVTEWLKDNITPTTPVVDASLTVSGAAADAKKTGEAVNTLKSAVNNVYSSNILWENADYSFYEKGNYPQTVLYSVLNPEANDIYTFVFDEIKNATAASPMYARLYDSENTQIRSTAWSEQNHRLQITPTDISAGVVRMDIIFYPAQGTPLQNPAEIINGYLLKGTTKEITPTEYFTTPVVNESVEKIDDNNYNTFEITDGTIELGDINSQTGADSASAARLRTKDYIPVAENTIITCDENMWLYHYDINTMAFKNRDNIWARTKNIDTPEYIRIVYYSTDTTKAKTTAFSNTPKTEKMVFAFKPYNIESLVKSISHRGRYTQGLALQNCEKAYIESAKYGYKYAENDMQLTSDNEIVMWHDTTLALIGDPTHSISDYTLEQLQAMDFNGETILTLKEWLVLCKSLGMKCYIDDKISEENFTYEIAENVVDTVFETGMKKSVSYIGHFDKIRTYHQDARLLILYPPTAAALEQYAPYLQNGEFVFDPSNTELTAENAKNALSAGFGLECYFVDYAANGYTTQEAVYNEIVRLVSLGVEGITLDFYKVEDAIKNKYEISQ